MSDRLIAWLREQIDEDERVAKAASEPGGPHWPNSDSETRTPQLEHARRHDPARVLAEVDAKRAMLVAAKGAAHDLSFAKARPPANEAERIERIRTLAALESRWSAWSFVLSEMAKVYADRPGYDEAVSG